MCCHILQRLSTSNYFFLFCERELHLGESRREQSPRRGWLGLALWDGARCAQFTGQILQFRYGYPFRVDVVADTCDDYGSYFTTEERR